MKRNRQPQEQTTHSNVSKKNKPTDSGSGNPALGLSKVSSPYKSIKSPLSGSRSPRNVLTGTRSPRAPLTDISACSPRATGRVPLGDLNSPNRSSKIPQSAALGSKPLSTKKLKSTQSPATSRIPSAINSPSSRASPKNITRLPQSPRLRSPQGIRSHNLGSSQGIKVSSRLPQSPQSTSVKKVKASKGDVEAMTTGEFLKMDIVMSTKTGRVKMRGHEHENVTTLQFPSPPEKDLNKSLEDIEPKVKSIAENFEEKLRDCSKASSDVFMEKEKVSLAPQRGCAIARGKHVVKERIKTPKRNIDLSALNEISPNMEVTENSDFSDAASSTNSPKVHRDNVLSEDHGVESLDTKTNSAEEEGENQTELMYSHESKIIHLKPERKESLNRSIENLDVDIKSLSKIFDTSKSQDEVIGTPIFGDRISDETNTPDRKVGSGKKDRGVAEQFRQVESIATPSQILKFNRGGVTLRQKNKGRKPGFSFKVDADVEKESETSQSTTTTTPEPPTQISVNIKSLRNIFESGGKVARTVQSRSDPKDRRMGICVTESPIRNIYESKQPTSVMESSSQVTTKIIISTPGGSQETTLGVEESVQGDLDVLEKQHMEDISQNDDETVRDNYPGKQNGSVEDKDAKNVKDNSDVGEDWCSPEKSYKKGEVGNKETVIVNSSVPANKDTPSAVMTETSNKSDQKDVQGREDSEIVYRTPTKMDTSSSLTDDVTTSHSKKSSIASRLAERLSRISENLKQLDDVEYVESPKSYARRAAAREYVAASSSGVPPFNDDNVFDSPTGNKNKKTKNEQNEAEKKEEANQLTVTTKTELGSKIVTKKSLNLSTISGKHKFSSVDVDPNEESEESPGKKRCLIMKYESTPIVHDRDVRFSVTLDDKTPATHWSITDIGDSMKSSGISNELLEGNLSETAFNKLLQTTCEGNSSNGVAESGQEPMQVSPTEAEKIDKPTSKADRNESNNNKSTLQMDGDGLNSKKPRFQADVSNGNNNTQSKEGNSKAVEQPKTSFSPSLSTWLDSMYKNELLECKDCTENIDDLYEQAVELMREQDSVGGGHGDLSFEEMVTNNQQAINRYHPQPVREVGGRSVAVPSASHPTPTERDVATGGETTGSIANRLTNLQQRGENEWRKRVGTKHDNVQREPVQLREKPQSRSERPVSLADRMSCLEDSQRNWKHRVGEKDASQFTVEGRMAQLGDRVAASPLVNKNRTNLQRESDLVNGNSTPLRARVNGSSPPRHDSSQGNRMAMPPDIVLMEASPKNADNLVSMASTPNIPTSSKIVSEGQQVQSSEDEEYDKQNTVVTVPVLDTKEFQSFYVSPSVTSLSRDRVKLRIEDLDVVQETQILPSARRARPPARKAPASRNPLKKLAQRPDLRTEYESHSTGVAEKELRRIKQQQIAGKACMATDALAALASKEDFDRVKLRKADNVTATPVSGGERFIPYKDIMLLHVKGRRSCHSRLVEPVASSINSGDCFILKTPQKVYVWVGEFCNVIEKSKALDVALTIQQKHDLGSKTSQPPVVIYENKPSMSAAKEFWDIIGGHQTSQAPGPVEEDELYEMYLSETNMVYRVHGDKLVPVREYWGQALKYAMLTDKEAFVFDFGSEVYLWTGKQVAFSERKVAMKLTSEIWGQGYDYTNCDINPLCPLRTPETGGLPTSAPTRPDWALLAKVSQNMETILFKEKFIDWPDSSSTVLALKDADRDKQLEVTDLKPCDVSEMLPLDTTPVDLVLEGSHIGRGDKWVDTHDGIRREFEICTLDTTVWHVLEYEHYQLNPQSYGQFHEEDTYVIRWRYMVTQSGIKSLKGHQAHSLTGREKCCYFFWQGRHSSITEKGASALMTVELDEERGPQIRVVQGKEPPCFIQLFSGHMICHMGKREAAETVTSGAWKLYVVRNQLVNEAYLLEVPPCVQNLRSRGSFVLLNIKTGSIFIWHGAKSTSHTKERARDSVEKLKERRASEVGVSSIVDLTITVVTEGTEPAKFWRGLHGNKTDLYSLAKESRLTEGTPRLFHLSSVSGVFVAKEIINPARSNDLLCSFPVLQSDLYKASQPALFLLSVGRTVYIWQGWWPEETEETENVKTGSAETRLSTDRILAMETAVNYCRELNPGRSPHCELVYAGVEPQSFTNLFPTWEPWNNVKDIQIKEGRFQGQTISIPEYLEKLAQTKYTYSDLQTRPLPEGVDPLNLEKYLHDDEFEQVLDMKKDDFYGLPLWKRNNIKKEKGLF